ncbi:lanthionine synthetase LanC family protein [Streptomyces sp. NPDC047974]|uniref:lanthionine synthetase LanC family protein n=1 Tax=Streptomyces sp. NPDC047974 TaxID=3154343 RepID=UPI0033EB8BEA
MTAREHIASAVAATTFVGDHGFAWFGKRPPRLPAPLTRSLDAQVRRDYLAQALAEHLYGYFYVKGHAAPMHWEAPTAAAGGTGPFVAALRSRNAGAGGWENGWRITPGPQPADPQPADPWPSGQWPPAPQPADPQPPDRRSTGPGPADPRPETRLEREGVRISVLDERLLRPRGPGSAELRMPAELLHRSPGHYLALSDAPVPAGAAVVRVYWNCTARGALDLMGELTRGLNGDGIPFQLKVLDDPAAYERCDAAVLYLTADTVDAARPHLERTHRQLTGARRIRSARIPVFTKELGPGVGLAEDTDHGRSFGMHRCRLLAEGLVEASAPARRSRRPELVGDYLTEHGVSLDTPYLRPGSADGYPAFGRTPGAPSARPAPVGEPTGSELCDEARRLCERLVADAFHDGDACTWLGSLVPDGTDRVLASLGPTLYDGLAGVALVLAQLDGPGFADTARAALRQAERRRGDLAPDRRPGLFDGWTGLALAQAYVARRLDDPALRAAARATAHEALTRPCTEHDLISGAAGTVLGALALVDLTGDRTLLDEAVRLGDLLVEHATPAGGGLAWSTINRKGEYHLTGLSHGTAGIALALAELAAATGESRFLATAEAGFGHERAWFDPGAGNWPDLRETRATRGVARGALAYSTYWCHGAPGIAVSRARAWQLTGDPVYRDEALKALATTRSFVRDTHPAGDQSLCHGLLGNAIVLTFAGRAVGDRESPGAARDAVARALAAHAGGSWPLGTPAESPGLMLGSSGIAHALLWLRDPAEPMVLLPGLI